MTPREAEHEASPDVVAPAPATPFTSRPLTLYGRRNWAAVFFFGFLTLLHAAIAYHAAPSNRWEIFIIGSMAGVFAVVTTLCCFIWTELTIVPLQRSIHIRRGVGRFCSRRRVPFGAVQAVRLTLGSAAESASANIEIVCSTELIECPPTPIPRQEALYLALVFGVQLIKIYGSEWENQIPVRTDRF